MQKRVEELRAMGVSYVFVVNPCSRQSRRVTDAGLLAITELRTANPEMLVPLEALFE